MAVTAAKTTPNSAAEAGPATAAEATKPDAEASASVANAAPPATVTLKQLAARLAEAQDMQKQQAEAVLDGVVGLLAEHLRASDRLRLGGLDVLEVRDRPAIGEAMQIAASRKVAFRPAKELKDAL